MYSPVGSTLGHARTFHHTAHTQENILTATEGWEAEERVEQVVLVLAVMVQKDNACHMTLHRPDMRMEVMMDIGQDTSPASPQGNWAVRVVKVTKVKGVKAVKVAKVKAAKVKAAKVKAVKVKAVKVKAVKVVKVKVVVVPVGKSPMMI